MKKSEKPFDAVKMIREIRGKLSMQFQTTRWSGRGIQPPRRSAWGVRVRHEGACGAGMTVDTKTDPAGLPAVSDPETQPWAQVSSAVGRAASSCDTAATARSRAVGA